MGPNFGFPEGESLITGGLVTTLINLELLCPLQYGSSGV